MQKVYAASGVNAHFFLIDSQKGDSREVDRLEAALRRTPRGAVFRVKAEADRLAGTDSSVMALLEELRRAESPQGEDAGLPPPARIVIGLGLAGSLALWMNILDRPRRRQVDLGRFTVALDEADPSHPELIHHVVAIQPFLGLDFQPGIRPQLGSDSLAEPLLSLCRRPFFRALGGAFKIRDPGAYGCFSQTGYISWADLAVRLPFASISRVLPSLKRPATILLEDSGGFATADLQIRALSGHVSVAPCGAESADRAQATLAAIDHILKGLGGSDA